MRAAGASGVASFGISMVLNACARSVASLDRGRHATPSGPAMQAPDSGLSWCGKVIV